MTWQDFETQFGLFYSSYSMPNVILPFLGGKFVDSVGTTISLALFSTFIIGGQVLFTLGLQANQLWLMLIGRIVYGFGGDNLMITQVSYYNYICSY